MTENVTCAQCRAPSPDCQCGTFPVEIVPEADRFRFSATCSDCGGEYDVPRDSILTNKILGADRIVLLVAPVYCGLCHHLREP
jgi:hypothetical protein